MLHLELIHTAPKVCVCRDVVNGNHAPHLAFSQEFHTNYTLLGTLRTVNFITHKIIGLEGVQSKPDEETWGINAAKG
jgi:hypothetical protein